ncbi:NAD-dependent epimerase/dehydratase family protein [Paenibacillus allorhizosphaerae]|uniref:2'-dehydrokanamycin reductase n=1 Tax=Paenibacillus allorhizosphaerae TaxID=2849866 RepID=A0ABN7TID4_9BACL|nr:NAD-dependent epimerase/dehydratase family protein [Paenibacillus allorhizosphaerae]CAG7631858.1 2'-dehydrokanamycin reductase [Paenibacillus allorhizosphaerae]
MKVLILGGTGVISRCIVEQLLAQGHHPVLFNRGTKKELFQDDVEWITGDKNDKDAFQSLMQPHRFDVVIDMISFNASDAGLTVQTFKERASQLIFCSSTAAYKRPFRTIPAQEDAEALVDDPVFPYAYHKAEMERYLHTVIAKGEIPVTIIRPSLTFGIGGANMGVLRQNVNLVHRIKSGKPLVMFGDGTVPWSFTFAPDTASAFAGAAGNERTYGQSYHATNEDLHVWEDLYLEIGKLVGREPQLVHMSSQLLHEANPGLFAHLYYEKQYSGLFDNSKIKRDIPTFRNGITLAEGLDMMLRWFEREGHPVEAEKDRLEDRLVEMYHRFGNELKALF